MKEPEPLDLTKSGRASDEAQPPLQPLRQGSKTQNAKKREAKSESKTQDQLKDMLGTVDKDPRKLRPKISTSYVEREEEDVTDQKDDSSLIKAAPTEKLDTLVAFYDEFITKPDNDRTIKQLISDLNFLL